MQYIEMLQNILEYIDKHLKEDLDVDLIASKANFSTYHFCRVFRFYVGYSVMEYVRIRRLLFSTMELTYGKRIIDIAIEYGFMTHSGYSKAFRKYFRCSPEKYLIHAHGKTPPLPSLLQTKKYLLGGIIMEPKFVTLNATKIVGYAIKTTTNEGENSKVIPEFWQAYLTDGRMEKLHKESFVKFHGEYGACFPENPETGEFEYAIGIEPVEGSEIPSEYYVNELPAATYAVFSTPPSNKANFSKNIQGTWGYIFNEWFPNSEYVFAEGCVDFEFYGDEAMSETAAICDIYIPVRNK